MATKQSKKGNEDTARLFGEALDFFSERVHKIGPDQWTAPTPCSEWTVRDLVNHVAVEQMWVPALVLEGSRVEDLSGRWEGDQLGDDPVAAWDKASTASLAAFRASGAMDRSVHLSSGDSKARDYCSQMAMDAAIHGWDLSRALGEDDTIPADLVNLSGEEIEPYAGQLAASGYFGEPVPVPKNADRQTKLLGKLGRRAS